MIIIHKVITRYKKSGCKRYAYYVNDNRCPKTRKAVHKFLYEVKAKYPKMELLVYKSYRYK